MTDYWFFNKFHLIEEMSEKGKNYNFFLEMKNYNQ